MTKDAPRDLGVVFDRLRTLMAGHVDGFEVVRDEPGDYYVNTRHARADGYVFMFGAVRTRARYVSFHLYPVAVAAELRDSLSPGLGRRMQGKSCFNFTVLDDVLLAELDAVTARSAALAEDPALFGI